MSTSETINLREYNRIFTGTNQKEGYDNPFLGFVTDTAAIILKADKSTYFHFPMTAPQIMLSSTDIINAGAFAGSIPYKSDRIFKKQANYAGSSPWGEAIPQNTQKGTWLCSWLSGNNSKEAISEDKFDIFAVGAGHSSVQSCTSTNPFGMGKYCYLTDGRVASGLSGSQTVTVSTPNYPFVGYYNFFVEVVYTKANHQTDPIVCPITGSAERTVFRSQHHWGYADAVLYTDQSCVSPMVYPPVGCLCATGSGANITITLPPANVIDGTQDTTPVWMDRWYDPGLLDSTHSLFASSTNAIYDVPSVLSFDPGVWYRYDHVGNNTNASFVDVLCGLQVHIDDWDMVSVDKSGNGNNATLQNFASSMISNGVNPLEVKNDTSLKLNGINQYAEILYSTSFNKKTDMSCNVWIKSVNWQNPATHHYISNGLRGGWNIGVNNGFFTPFGVLVDADGDIVFNNQTDNFYTDIHMPGTPAPVAFLVDSELYTWVLDNGQYQGSKHLYKIDYNGNVDSFVIFDAGIELKDIAIDANNWVWVASDQLYASAFDTFGQLMSTSTINGSKLVCNLNGLTAFNAKDADVFDNDIYWTIDSIGNVYYSILGETTLALSGASATNVKCSKDYAWVLFDIDKIARFDKSVIQLTDEITFVQSISTTIPDTPYTAISGRNLYFTNEFTGVANHDYVWILQPNTEYLYKYDTSLNLQQKVNTTYIKNGIQSNAIIGDSSGYHWHRSYNYTTLAVSGTPQIEASIYLGTGNPVLTGQKYKTILPVSALTTNDWHMFTTTIDSSNNTIQLYVDTRLRDTVSIPISSEVFYKYETPLLLGSNIGRIQTLDDELNKIKRIYHTGELDDLRIYTHPLNIDDIRHLYFTKYNFKDLIWDIPTGYQSYVEEIVRFFKFKMPGQKSQFYNIRLKGMQIEDTNVRKLIEDIIKDSIKKIEPLYTSLYRIIWD